MKPKETKETIEAWLETLPEGPPWTADDPDPLIRKAVQHGFTMAQPATSASNSALSQAHSQPTKQTTSSVSNRLTDSEIESLRQEAKLADLQIQALLAGTGAGAPEKSGS